MYKIIVFVTNQDEHHIVSIAFGIVVFMTVFSVILHLYTTPIQYQKKRDKCERKQKNDQIIRINHTNNKNYVNHNIFSIWSPYIGPTIE